ncbi:FAD-binding oxidoreductase [Nocardioides anomalus]|uniref:D-amino-acid oxidase n=1 Tax=Nocardioides anomalus TaxID=2712223 RepID=A0A6G6WF85_9ACTN|nr:FAD-dependent oxidoreductase [Nocardioides anomalus]QIG43817.1 FAD-binding oxidoreductase [Nocardioides anomalus]
MGRVVVVGAGVLGLSCAVRLLEAGHRVDVLARDLPRETTSAVAAAIWYPYRAWPEDRVLGWCTTTYAAFADLAADPRSGVRMQVGTEVVASRGSRPWWAAAVPDLRETLEVPAGYDGGWSFTAPVVEMPVYLAWLAARVLELGGSVTRLNLQALPAAGAGGADAVVDCAGIGAKHLAADPSVHPVQGQVVLVEQVGLARWWLDPGTAGSPTYVVPRSRDVVVGGTDVEGEWSRTPSPEVASAILRRALRLVPELAGAEVLGHKVGLRPGRPEVRLERVGDVVHCYGHGGAGVTLSWGCADEVAGLLA